MKLEASSEMPAETQRCANTDEVIALERRRLDELTRPFSAPRASVFWTPTARALEGKK